jgi:hypothetical protein
MAKIRKESAAAQIKAQAVLYQIVTWKISTVHQSEIIDWI